ncbi:DAK2 domain-containing protein [Corynebacterium bovis]|uniref:DAK2 domain-containing protein n=1 Tax=Corynebacterium bovis TaxID=36808 RepID=UPI002550E665|nr:DAK2 domain-containing protein [Corynebacterium bovis]MDK8510279.1 DAK2 domain-containing protein [Corynebacterium bovis]
MSDAGAGVGAGAGAGAGAGDVVVRWARRAARDLEHRKDEINRLNVFPIPDSDTGANLSATMAAAVDALAGTGAGTGESGGAGARAGAGAGVRAGFGAGTGDGAGAGETVDAGGGTGTGDATGQGPDVAVVTAALAGGAVRGARGNSGTVLGQVLRALADVASTDELGAGSLARIMTTAVRYVTEALSTPVEGTALTVLRAAADAATDARGPAVDVARAAADAARAALARTPDLLPVLREAGVVDAGGRGFVVLLDALVETLGGDGDGRGGAGGEGGDRGDGAGGDGDGRGGAGGEGGDRGDGAGGDGDGRGGAGGEGGDRGDGAGLGGAGGAASDGDTPGGAAGAGSAGAPVGGPTRDDAHAHADARADADAHARAHAPAGAELEVMFHFRGETAAALDDLRRMMDGRGHSVVLGRDTATSATVHVHTGDAGALIEDAFALGTVSDLRIEALPSTSPTPRRHPGPGAGLLALVPAGPLRDVFAEAGAETDADAELGERCVVLTNGRDATPVIDHLEADRRQFSVIDTECYVGGLAALAVHDATNDWQDDVEDMADAVASQRWTSISCDGDGAGVDAGTLVRRIRDLLESGGELVTLLYTSAVPAETLADVHRALAEDAPGVEIHAYRADGMECAVQIGVE